MRFKRFAWGYEIGTLTTTELSEPLNRALFSGFATMQDAAERRAAMYLGAIGVSAVIVFPAGVGISLIASPLVHLLLGVQWLSVIELVQIVAIASTLSVLSGIGAAFLMASGGVRYAFAMLLVSATIRCPVMLGCVWQWGLVGAGIATAVSLAIDQCSSFFVVLPRIGVRVAEVLLRLWRPFGACLVMIGLLYSVDMAWLPPRDTSLSGLALDAGTRALIGTVTYVGALILFWVAAGRPDGAERQVMALVGKRLARG